MPTRVETYGRTEQAREILQGSAEALHSTVFGYGLCMTNPRFRIAGRIVVNSHRLIRDSSGLSVGDELTDDTVEDCE